MTNRLETVTPDEQNLKRPPARRVPLWTILLCSLGLTTAAIGVTSFQGLLLLTALNVVFGAVLSLKLNSLSGELRLVLLQTAILLGLYLLRFGFPEGLLPAFRVSWKIFLAFVPGIMVFKGISQERLIRTLNRYLPSTLSFVLVTSLRFIPLLRDEFQKIYEAQLLRGGRIRLKDLPYPRSWPDVIHCLLLPCIVQSLKIAGDIALAARIRGLGNSKHKTRWPGA